MTPADPGRGLRERLKAEGLETVSWSNPAWDRYGVHHHGYDKVIVVEQGSIHYGLPRGDAVDLVVGDRLELPAGTEHDALVGPDGVTCLEAHLAAGSVAGIRRTGAGSW